MTAVTNSGTSDDIFDPWLYDQKWDVQTLTYNFPEDGSCFSYQPNFCVSKLLDSQKDAMRTVLDDIASFTRMIFVEVAETTATETDLRFARQARLGEGCQSLIDHATTDQALDLVSGENLIDLSELIVGTFTPSIDQAGSGGGVASVKTRDQEGRIVIQVDVDGDASTDMQIFLMNTTEVTTADVLR